jgi:hypothetical protein
LVLLVPLIVLIKRWEERLDERDEDNMLARFLAAMGSWWPF